MNSGYNPILNTPVQVANNQAQSQQPPFYFGGSSVPNALGFVPKVTPIITKKKTFDKLPSMQ
jgi:hypothetical protein